MEDRASRFGVDPFRGQLLQVWQGTILSSGSGHGRSDKLVVSADCDLLNDKGAGEFFTLDLLSADAFLSAHVCPAVCGDLLNLITDAARDIASTRNKSFARVNLAILAEWVVEGNLDRWTRDLPNLQPNDRDLLTAFADCARKIKLISNRTTLQPAIGNYHRDVFVSSSNLQIKAVIDQVNRKIRKVFESHLQPSRADLYILPSLPGRANAGHFVPFKSLSLMNRQLVCTSRVDLIERHDAYVPVALCRTALLQSLLQKLMLYFTRIGVTNSFKEDQEGVFRSVMAEVLR